MKRPSQSNQSYRLQLLASSLLAGFSLLGGLGFPTVALAQNTPAAKTEPSTKMEEREFTDNKNRKIKASVKSATATKVTILRADGKEFTLDRQTLSPADDVFITERTGIPWVSGKESPSTPVGAGPAGTTKPGATPGQAAAKPAGPTTWQMEAKVSNGKKSELSKMEDFDDREQSIQVTVELENREANRDFPKGKLHLMVFSRHVDGNKNAVMEANDQFDIAEMKRLTKASFTMLGTVKLLYDDKAFAKYGKKYMGYLVVVKDEAGKTVYQRSVPATLTKHSEQIMLASVGTEFNNQMKALKSSMTR